MNEAWVKDAALRSDVKLYSIVFKDIKAVRFFPLKPLDDVWTSTLLVLATKESHSVKKARTPARLWHTSRLSFLFVRSPFWIRWAGPSKRPHPSDCRAPRRPERSGDLSAFVSFQ